ncbi:unnamed protein product [Discosporangium mesarthrocarpum]
MSASQEEIRAGADDINGIVDSDRRCNPQPIDEDVPAPTGGEVPTTGEEDVKKRGKKKGKKKKGVAAEGIERDNPSGDSGLLEESNGAKADGDEVESMALDGAGAMSGAQVGVEGGTPTTANGMDLIRLFKQKQMEEMAQRKAGRGGPKKEHKFWDTQPMMKKKEGEGDIVSGEIEAKTVEEVKDDPYNMPPGFEWCHVDVMDDVEAEEVYVLLSENYVEDDDNMFRFDYSKEFLRWALTPPGYSADLHVGVRSSRGKGKLMGLITAVPTTMRVMEHSVKTVEINFLCVHKKLRAKRLAPVLIKEITRRVNKKGIWQVKETKKRETIGLGLGQEKR